MTRKQTIDKAEDDYQEPPFAVFDNDPHIYEGERCIYCNVNVYDDALYGPHTCIEREPFVYTTSSKPRPDSARTDPAQAQP